MSELSVKGFAKINITLDILGKRGDGYHEVSMIMQSVSLADTLVFRRTDAGLSLASNRPDVPLGQDNLVAKVFTTLKKKYKFSGGAHVYIDKQIPVAAGLAGGSADAAAALNGFNKLFNLGLDLPALMEVGSQLGSDIPFCIMGGTALARGRGEIVIPLPDLPEVWLVVVKPPFPLSTAAVYSRFSMEKVTRRPDQGRAIKAVQTGEFTSLLPEMVNVLETVSFELHPEIGLLKERLLTLGALGALMSGSGPSVFGVMPDYQQAVLVAELLKKDYKEVFVAQTINSGWFRG